MTRLTRRLLGWGLAVTGSAILGLTLVEDRIADSTLTYESLPKPDEGF